MGAPLSFASRSPLDFSFRRRITRADLPVCSATAPDRRRRLSRSMFGWARCLCTAQYWAACRPR